MRNKIAGSLIFNDCTEEAIRYYTQLISDSAVKDVIRYKAFGTRKVGRIMHATVVIKNQEFMCIDSAVKYDFTFAPAVSLYLNCDTKAEIETLFKELSKNGKVFMELASYGFSDLYGWVEDKFGVSWQLNLD